MTRTTMIAGIAYTAFGLAYGRLCIKSLQNDPVHRETIFGSTERMMFFGLVLAIASLGWPIFAIFEFGTSWFVAKRVQAEAGLRGGGVVTLPSSRMRAKNLELQKYTDEQLRRWILEHYEDGLAIAAELTRRNISLPAPILDLFENVSFDSVKPETKPCGCLPPAQCSSCVQVPWV